MNDSGREADVAALARSSSGRVSRRGRGPLLLFGALAVGIAVADQLVKRWILAGFELGAPVQIVGDYLRITLVHNDGGLFGLFAGQALLFAAASLVIIGGIAWFEATAGRESLALTLALGLLLGGALGNLIDRVRFGYVLDFVDAGFGTWRWYTSNVADMSISVALVLLVLIGLGVLEGGSRALALHGRSSGR